MPSDEELVRVQIALWQEMVRLGYEPTADAVNRLQRCAIAASDQRIEQLEAEKCDLLSTLEWLVERHDRRERDWIKSGDDCKAIGHARRTVAVFKETGDAE